MTQVMTNKYLYLLLDDGSTTALESMDRVVSNESSLEDNIQSYIWELTTSSNSQTRLLRKDEAFFLLAEHEKLVADISKRDNEKESWKEPDTCVNIISVSSTDSSTSLDPNSSSMQGDDILETRDAVIREVVEISREGMNETPMTQSDPPNELDTHTGDMLTKEMIRMEVDNPKEKVDTDTDDSSINESIDQDSLSFTNYTDLLTYISSSQEWMSKADVARQIQKYNLELEKQGCMEMLQKYRQASEKKQVVLQSSFSTF
jgi:hypothetical protein